MDDNHRKELIIEMLQGNGSMTTNDVVAALKEYNKNNPSPACHDSTVLALISLKREKKISGVMNREKRSWEWTIA